VAGLAGPDVSKTEEIKAPAAWISPRNPAMIRCFRCRAAWCPGQSPPFWTPVAGSTRRTAPTWSAGVGRAAESCDNSRPALRPSDGNWPEVFSSDPLFP